MPARPSVQRVSLEPDTHRVLAYGTTVPTSWTTVYTVAQRVRTEIIWVSFVATNATAYTVQMRLQSPSGTNIEIAQAQLAGDGEQWFPLKESTTIPMDPGWKLQIIGSGAVSVAVNYLVSGVERKTPT